MKLWVGCEVRTGKRPHYVGYALLVDLETGKPLGKYVPPEVFDESMPPNAIGRESMGVRQVLQVGDEWFVGTNAGVIVLGPDFQERRRITNEFYVGGHALVRCPHSGELWFNSTPADSLVRMTLDGDVERVVNLTQRSNWARRLGVTVRHPFTRNLRAITEEDCTREKADYDLDQMHLNAIQFHDGDMYATACTQRAFLRVWPDPDIVLQDHDLSSPHDFTIVGDRIVVNDSGNRAVVIYDMKGNRQGVVQLHSTGDGPTSMSGWTRGLAVLDDEHVLVGTTPLGFMKINIAKVRVEEEVRFTDVVRDSCHGLSLVRG